MLGEKDQALNDLNSGQMEVENDQKEQKWCFLSLHQESLT